MPESPIMLESDGQLSEIKVVGDESVFQSMDYLENPVTSREKTSFKEKTPS